MSHLSQNVVASEGALDEALHGAIDRALYEKRIVGTVVLVARDGEIVFQRAAGFLDREAGTAMRPDGIFRLASITKPLVTAAAMRFVERGEISLDDPVARWLPDFRPALADGSRPDITLHQLLTHTSGLSYRFLEPAGSDYHRLNVSDGLDQPGLSISENLERLGRTTLAFRPGDGWRYSLGIDVIGAVLEVVSGRPLAEIVRAEVTGPLGLADTDFAVVDRTRLAVPYADGKDGPTRMEGTVEVPLFEGFVRFSPDRIDNPASFASGGGGMAGAAADILAFLEAIRNGGGPILKPETVKAMMSDQVGPSAQTQGPGWGFGYGWAVLDDAAPTATPQAPGTLQWGGAYGHSWFIDPARRLVVVALTNTAFEGMAGQFVIDIRDAALTLHNR